MQANLDNENYHINEKGKTNIAKNNVNYNWPYSQPDIINIIKATKLFGISLGLSTLPLISLPIYHMFIDTTLLITYLILYVITIPLIRRNIIKETVSLDNKFNVKALNIICVLMHSSIIRIIYIFISSISNINAFINKIIININPLTFIIAIIPSILIIYPKSKSVYMEHCFTISNLYDKKEREEIERQEKEYQELMQTVDSINKSIIKNSSPKTHTVNECLNKGIKQSNYKPICHSKEEMGYTTTKPKTPIERPNEIKDNLTHRKIRGKKPNQ